MSRVNHVANHLNSDYRLARSAQPVNCLSSVHRLALSTCPSSSGSATIPASTCSTPPPRTTTGSRSSCSMGSTRWQLGSAMPSSSHPSTRAPFRPASVRNCCDGRRRLRDAGREAVDRDVARAADYRGLDAIVAEVPVRLAHSGVSGRNIPVEAATPHDRIRLALALAVLDATRLDRSRVRCCGRQGCVLLFFDTSKNSTRRWCDMAVCGNRAKAAAHYERHRPDVPTRR